MRITTGMMTNTTLLHINRNMRNLDQIIRQIETTKRIGVPSDNPIVASRALKFRTGVIENEVFRNNVNNAQAWMNITDSALTNINSELLARINELLVTVTSQTNRPVPDMMALITQMESLFDELTTNINQTMGGRYVFSGLRTDEPPVFKANNERSFIITQNFNINDIARTSTFQRVPREGDYLMDTLVRQNVSIINLAFANITTQPELGLPQPQPQPIPSPSPWRTHVDNPSGIHIPGFHIRKVSINDPQAYEPPPSAGGFVPPMVPDLPVLHLITETGELVMHNDTAQLFPREGISVTYKREGFSAGELNPAVYFESREIIDPTDLNPDNINRIYSLTMGLNRVAGDSVTTPGYINFTLVPAPLFAGVDGAGNFNDPASALRPSLPPGAIFTAPATVSVPAHLFDTHSNLSVTFSAQNPLPNVPASPGPIVPTHIKQNLNFTQVTLVRALDATSGVPIPLDQAEPNRSFTQANQDLTMEFAANTHLAINTHASNVLTDKMFGDFRRLFEFKTAIRFTTEEALREHYRGLGFSGNALDDMVMAQQIKEESDARGALYHVLNNMLARIRIHQGQANSQQTVNGARMVRMELLENRHEADEVTLHDLKSSNEDTDMIRAIILRMSAEAQFMASLQANSGIVNMSLANFIRI